MPDVGSKQSFETLTDLDPILRKKKLIAEMMKARYAASLNDSPTVDAGPGAVRPVNWAGPLGRVVEGLGAEYHSRKLDDEEKALAVKTESDRQSGVDAKYEPFKKDTNIVANDDEGNAMPPAMALTDPSLKSNYAAEKSVNPGVAASGAQNQHEWAKQLAELMQKRGAPQSMSHDGVGTTWPEGFGGPSSQTALNQYGPMAAAKPGLPAGQPNLATGEIKTSAAPLGVGDQTGNIIAKQGAEKAIERAQKSFDTVTQVKQQLPGLTTAIDLLGTGKVISGAPWSGLSIDAQKALNTWGIVPDQNGAIPSTEFVMAKMAKGAEELLATLRPASDTDVKLAYERAGAYPKNDPRYAQTLAREAVALAYNSQMQHQRNRSAIDHFSKMEGLDPQTKSAIEATKASLWHDMALKPVKGVKAPEDFGGNYQAEYDLLDSPSRSTAATPARSKGVKKGGKVDLDQYLLKPQ